MATKKKRNYKKEYANYQGKPEQKKKRAMRNTARRRAEAKGKVHKGDGKDIDHKRTLKNGGSNAESNTRVRSRHSNRAAGGRSGNKAGKARGGRKSKRT